MAKNEFLDHKNLLGLFESEPEPFSFLSIDKISKKVTDSPNAEINFRIKLSNKVHTYERQVYTIFTMVSDIGGFYGAIVIIPTLFVQFYSSRMFNMSLQEELPVRRTNTKHKSSKYE